MRSLPALRATLIALTVGCLPSQFDDLTPRGEAEDPSTACDASAGCAAADAGTSPEDASLPQGDASARDAGARDAGARDAGAADAGPPTCRASGACKPGTVAACDPSDRCGERACKADCTWDACRSVKKTANACILRRITPQDGVQMEGTSYRCCAPGKWSFCLPETCEFSPECAPCDEDFCECHDA